MTTYKQIIEISPEELTLLNQLCERRESPFTFEELETLQDELERLPDNKAWIMQLVNEKADIDVLDVMITAEFANGMIMDVYYWGMVDSERGVYAGIQFGDKDRIYIEPQECFEDCYAIEPEDAEPNHRPHVEGTYKIFYKGDVYETEIRSA